MYDRDQLAFFFGAQEIERSLDMTPGAAQAKLRKLCSSGKVRSWRKPYSMLNGEPQGECIEPSEWRRREIDLMTDSDGCSYFVDVSKTDLLGWLKAKQRPQRGGKQPRILKHLSTIFPNKRVPDPSDYSRKALRADLVER